MSLSTFECITAITQASARFAQAARGSLDAAVEGCPDWSVADLVWHLSEVHWFWATIVEEGLDAPPAESRKPARPEEERLVETFVVGAARLVQVLREADQAAPCWTWAGGQQDVAFVTRHQVQETVVHAWDAARAAGASWHVDEDVAADAVDEFLHFSVASQDDPDEPTTPPLEGSIAFLALDTGDGWTLSDGTRPGTAQVAPEVLTGVPVVSGRAAELLLWLYGRIPLQTLDVPDELVARFRALCFTD